MATLVRTYLKAPFLSAPAPADGHRADLILHIGSGKTGTTSIQAYLQTNRDRLAELGFLYPRSPGRLRHTRISLSVLPDDVLDKTPSWKRQGFGSAVRFREVVRRRLRDEMTGAGLPHVILSDEALYGIPYAALDSLRRFTDEFARTVRVVVYLRRQDDHLASRYQQVVKVGETRRLEERVRAMDLSGLYDYHARLTAWVRVMEPGSFVVRPFERASFADGSLHQDFLDAAGVGARAADLRQVTQLNESLDAESVELLRILNLCRLEHAEAAAALPGNRELVLRLRDAMGEPGPTLTLPPAMLDEFMASWAESNRAVARDFLGNPTGELFTTPRKTGDTTSRQFFDPARLDHFLRVLELPDELHGPLRDLVEREATSVR